jgi:Flp pilus assembly protein TadB
MNPGILVGGIALSLLAALTLVFFVIAPPPPRVARERRLAPGVEHISFVGRATSKTTSMVESAIARRRGRFFGADELELAGIESTPSQFIVIVASCASLFALIGFLFGLVTGMPIVLALIFALLTPLVAKMIVSVRTSRRKSKFADQVDDSLQLIAGGLRAGHGLTVAVSAVAGDANSPMREELTRAVNEARLGSSLPDALARTAQRMESKDFEWVAQAVAINAETGGNLAEVLDQVGKTIRDRNQIRRQVKALSAEGRMSGIILVVLPIALFLFFSIIQPTYVAVFFQNIVGILALILAFILLILGTIWVAMVVRVRF